jgi:hypothetical protein
MVVYEHMFALLADVPAAAYAHSGDGLLALAGEANRWPGQR